MIIEKKSEMPRGELDNFLLLCSSRDQQNILHGIGLRKNPEGSIRINIEDAEYSSFSEQNLILTLVNDNIEDRSFRVDPELQGIKILETDLSEENRFTDSDDIKNAISKLLETCVRITLNTYHGLCKIKVPEDTKLRPSFVFASTRGYQLLTVNL